MGIKISLFSYIVKDYDEAINWFVTKLGFELIEDSPRENGKRWVVIGANGGNFLLAKANNEIQLKTIGNQFGGRVGLFLETDDFEGTFEKMLKSGVKFLEKVRHEEYGKVVVFEDLYGTKWDLLEYK